MTKMIPTVDYPTNNFETPHHRNLKIDEYVVDHRGIDED